MPTRRRLWGACCLLPLIGVAALVAFMLLTGGGMDYRVNLPNGYQLVRVYSECNLLVTPHSEVVVGPTVDRYAVIGSVVTGRVSPEQNHPGTRIGYFVLDTRSGGLRSGLNRAQWVRALRSSGVIREPRLTRPNRFHALGNIWH